MRYAVICKLRGRPRLSAVRKLELGRRPMRYYTGKSRAAYWDGRNNVGERVANGIYLYQLQVDTTSLLRKMVILKLIGRLSLCKGRSVCVPFAEVRPTGIAGNTKTPIPTAPCSHSARGRETPMEEKS